MVNPIMPIGMGDEAAAGDLEGVQLAQVTGAGATPGLDGKMSLSANPFDSILSKAVESLNSVSQSEFKANQLIDDYMKGKADLQEVMVATSKMNIMVNLGVTVVTSAVTSFKELTAMQI